MKIVVAIGFVIIQTCNMAYCHLTTSLCRNRLWRGRFSFMSLEFLLASLYHFLDLNNACLLVLRIAELLIIE